MRKVNGHAVRAMYLYTGMADTAAITDNKDYRDALQSLWENVALRNMYITGGIGPSQFNEGFTEDYDLPNDAAYCETCASVGMVFWNHRLNLLYGDSKYADIVERAMYNGVLAGVSLKGDKFFYVNPLSSDGTHHREEWYDCSCCPTQIARFIPSIGNYVYAVSKKGIWVNLYIAGKGNIYLKEDSVELIQNTDYPWSGRVEITVSVLKAVDFLINLRFPGWCRSVALEINDKPIVDLSIEKGYIKIYRKWSDGDRIKLDLDMPVEVLHSHPKVKANVGRVAIQRGPLVYCVEEANNHTGFSEITLSPESRFVAEYRPDLLNGVVTVTAIAPEAKYKLTAIPYYAWDNRKAGRMEVWLPEKKVSDTNRLYS
jgi:DUF1680 family protein